MVLCVCSASVRDFVFNVSMYILLCGGSEVFTIMFVCCIECVV